MQINSAVIQDWIQETGYPDLVAAAQSALLIYPKLFEKNSDGSLTVDSIKAHHAFTKLDEKVVALITMKEKYNSLEG